jgi:hypothetical protein
MGEKSKSIGEEAEDKIWAFLDSLGYKIHVTNEPKYNIDCIAESPPKNPVYGMAKPLYAPEGLTAFEVKVPAASPKNVMKFREKIRKHNRENTGDKRLKGGIFLADRRISSKILEFMRTQKIWGWGVERQRLYREKANIFENFKLKAFMTEIPLDESCSYLRCSTPPPTKSKTLLHVAVFFDDDFHLLSPIRVRKVMNEIKEKSMIPLMNHGIKPLNMFFEFYSIGGLSKYLREEIYKTVIEPWKAEQISVFVDKSPFKDFRTFPTL